MAPRPPSTDRPSTTRPSGSHPASRQSSTNQSPDKQSGTSPSGGKQSGGKQSTPKRSGKKPAGKRSTRTGSSTSGGSKRPDRARKFARPATAVRRAPAKKEDVDDDDSGDGGVRLQRFLAMAGVGARRECEELITTGRVMVDGKVVAELGARVIPGQSDVRLDGERVKQEKRVYYMVNKPTGVICTNHDQSGRPRAVDIIPHSRERLFTVGRLDEHSEGLLLITNDGELANELAHPRFQIPKVYRVHVQGVPTRETLAELCKGMYFAEGKFKARDAQLKKAGKTSSIIDLTLTEGQNREVRRMLAKLGHKVLTLTRISLGNLKLGPLPVGNWRQLSPPELVALRELSHGKSRRTRRRNPTGAEQRPKSKRPAGRTAREDRDELPEG